MDLPSPKSHQRGNFCCLSHSPFLRCCSCHTAHGVTIRNRIKKAKIAVTNKASDSIIISFPFLDVSDKIGRGVDIRPTTIRISHLHLVVHAGAFPAPRVFRVFCLSPRHRPIYVSLPIRVVFPFLKRKPRQTSLALTFIFSHFLSFLL